MNLPLKGAIFFRNGVFSQVFPTAQTPTPPVSTDFVTWERVTFQIIKAFLVMLSNVRENDIGFWHNYASHLNRLDSELLLRVGLVIGGVIS